MSDRFAIANMVLAKDRGPQNRKGYHGPALGWLNDPERGDERFKLDRRQTPSM